MMKCVPDDCPASGGTHLLPHGDVSSADGRQVPPHQRAGRSARQTAGTTQRRKCQRRNGTVDKKGTTVPDVSWSLGVS